VYAWWVRNGFKRKDGFTLGGNAAFHLLRHLHSLVHFQDNNYVSISAYDEKFQMVVDLTDFEVPHHTLPLSLGKDSETRLLELFFPRAGTFVDVGANYGFYSLVASHLGGEKAVVCAYEPQPQVARAIEMSQQLNRFTQLRTRTIVLGDRSDEVEFFIPDTGSGVGSLFREHAGRFRPVLKKIVKMETLDAALKLEKLSRLDMLKIDVEGAEFAVLKGATSTIRNYQPFIWFEMNPEAQTIAHREQDEIYSLLQGLGYADFYDVSEVVAGRVHPIRHVSTLTNVLAVPTSKTEDFYARLAHADGAQV
jgi:FkbM family methyltransferase